MVKAFLVIVVIFGFLVLRVALKSPDMLIARELEMKAPPSKIFPYINTSSKKANDWMPWAESDPKMKMSFSGPEEGVGSTSTWVSEGRMGVGSAVVVESKLNEFVKTQLTYEKPMKMSQLAEISLRQTQGGTIVRWQVTGRNSFISRFFCSFMDVDKVVGSQFEKGLQNLKKKVE